MRSHPYRIYQLLEYRPTLKMKTYLAPNQTVFVDQQKYNLFKFVSCSVAESYNVCIIFAVVSRPTVLSSMDVEIFNGLTSTFLRGIASNACKPFKYVFASIVAIVSREFDQHTSKFKARFISVVDTYYIKQ